MNKTLHKTGGFAMALLMATTILVPAFASAETTNNSCVTFVRDLTLGSTGSDVASLQTFLEGKGALTIPAGTSKGYFGVLTRSALAQYQSKNAINPPAGYFGPVTRANVNIDCANGSTPAPSNPGSNTGGLQGGAGDIQSIDKTNSGTEKTLGEGKSEDVLGFDVEADDNSDLEITSIRLNIDINSNGSNRLNRYLDEATIMLDGKEVGSVKVSKFSRSGSSNSATISLKKAIIDAGDKGRFYVNLTARDSINDSDLDNTLVVKVDRVRFEDASGAILTENPTNISDTVDFEDASANDNARVQSNNSNPNSSILKVEDNKSSEDHEVFAFNIKVDDNSSDLVVTKLPINFEIKNASSTAALDVNKFMQDVWIEVDGEKYDEYTLNDTSVAAGATETVTATFNIDEGDLEISEGDTVDAVVFVKFGKQAGNYALSTKIEASVTGSAIDAENTEGDNFTIKGSVSGKTHTVQISAATIDNFKFTPATGTNVTTENNGSFIDFYFTVEVEDEDFDVLAASIVTTTSGNATTDAGTLTFNAGDEPDTVSGGFRVLDGDKTTFRVRYLVSGTSGQLSEVKVTSVAGQEVPSSSQRSGTLSIK